MGGFLTAIRVDKSRYARDQFRLIHSLLDKYGVEAALQAPLTRRGQSFLWFYLRHP